MVTLLLTPFLHILFLIQQPQSEIIDGYTNQLSAYPGDSIELYLNARYALINYNLRLYDLSGKEVASVNMEIAPQTPANENSFETGFGYALAKKVIVPNLFPSIARSVQQSEINS